jgi:hypothetical protein
MKQNTLLRIFLGILLLSVAFANAAAAQNKTVPGSNNGEKWRIGYLEAGDSKEAYEESLRGLIHGLIQLGWLDQYGAVPENKGTKELWEWLSKPDRSSYIEFVQDAYMESGGDDDAARRREENKKAVLQRLATQQDLNMIIAMGTRAGEDMAEADDLLDKANVNVMVMEASNPVKSGIVKSEDKSGRPHVHAMLEPNLYKNQIVDFAEVFKETKGFYFKTLGIVYINSPEGRSFAALDAVHAQKKQLGFTPDECPLPAEAATWPREELVKQVQACYEKLAPKIDAMYMTSHLGVNKKDICSLIRPMLKQRVPIWSQEGGFEVEYGALMGLTRPNPADVGFFEAKVMAQILNGVSPENISQIFHDPKEKTVSLNLRTAQLIRFSPSWSVLATAEDVFETINPEDDCNVNE